MRGPQKITIYSDQAKGEKVFFRIEDDIVKLVIFNKKYGVDVYRIKNSKVRKLLGWLSWFQRRK